MTFMVHVVEKRTRRGLVQADTLAQAVALVEANPAGLHYDEEFNPEPEREIISVEAE